MTSVPIEAWPTPDLYAEGREMRPTSRGNESCAEVASPQASSPQVDDHDVVGVRRSDRQPGSTRIEGHGVRRRGRRDDGVRHVPVRVVRGDGAVVADHVQSAVRGRVEDASQGAGLHGEHDFRWPWAQPYKDGFLGAVGPAAVDCVVVTEHRAASLPEPAGDTVDAAQVQVVDELVALPVGSTQTRAEPGVYVAKSMPMVTPCRLRSR